MGYKLFFFYLFLFPLMANAQRLSGIDLRFENGTIARNVDRDRHLLSYFTTPAGLEHYNSGYQSQLYNSSYQGACAELVMGVRPVGNTSMIREIRAGYSFLVSSDYGAHVAYDNYNGDYNRQKHVDYTLRLYRNQVSVSYLVNSKPMRGHWRFYAGSGLGVLTSLWKGGSPRSQSTYLVSVVNKPNPDSILNYQVIYRADELKSHHNYGLNAHLFAGLKYNLSCDINLFLEYRYSGAFHLNDTHYWQSANAFSIGFRYKFKNGDQRKEEKSDHAFW